MDSSQYAALFLTESREHLSAINHRLLELERGSGAEVSAEAVDSIFRAVHTIKGMSATMGYDQVAELSHELETTLELVRRRQLRVTRSITDLLFRAADALEGSIEAAVRGTEGPSDIPKLLQRLRGERAATPSGKFPAVPHPPQKGGADGGAAPWSLPIPDGEGLPVRVRIDPDAPLKSVRAFMILRALGGLGTVEATLPSFEAINGSDFDGELAIRLGTGTPAAEVEEIVRRQGEVAHVVAGSAAVKPRRTSTPRGVPAVRKEGVGTPTRGMAPVGGHRRQQHVRIELRRLDTLMNLIGELVIARGRLAQIARDTGNRALEETVAQASRLVGDLQNEIMQSRLVPVWQVFDRFPRVVRDTARSTGKEVEFSIEGKEIELDRSMLDEIGDPVIHLLRNAIDHGIESPDERTVAGKPAAGRLVLSTVRERSAVEIRVEDDGRGIDRARVLQRAHERALLDPAKTELTDEELIRVIAHPGFSTADKVTGISGRGVGMDVVFNRVRALGGSVDIRTETGRGTAVTLRLPLTLAIVRALVARVGRESYAVPLTHVAETVELTGESLRSVKGKEVLLLRDDVLPVIRLRELVELPRNGVTGEQVVVLETAARRAALVVDELTTQQEIVVKQFDTPRGARAAFGGATILGDGLPALILDVSSLL